MDTSVTNEMQALPMTLEGDHGFGREEKDFHIHERQTYDSIRSVQTKPMNLSRYEPYADKCDSKYINVAPNPKQRVSNQHNPYQSTSLKSTSL